MDERQYDLIFILQPATPEEEIDKLVATLQQTASERGGTVDKVEKWGTRRLAYRVAKNREGYYVYLVLRSSNSEMVKELERRLKVADAVIKFQTIRLDEELKRQKKLVQRRERRAGRRPRKPAAAAPSAPPAAPVPELPAAAAS